MTNSNLHNAKVRKNDEFYTRLEDIESEVRHYANLLRDKVVYCNCDDYRISNFFRYFKENFHTLGLKKVVSTCYDNGKGSWKAEYDGEEIRITELSGNGSFNSEECLEILRDCDVVITNPPFSLFREYIAQLVKYAKKFLVIGNVNAVTYKEIFPLIKDNRIWLGTSPHGMFFISGKDNVRITARWFTNMNHDRRKSGILLTQWYGRNPRNYPRYDNYDAIEVSKVCDIPMDYEGVMGVPITFLDSYCPEQFEILGIQQRNDDPYKIKRYDKSMYKNANDLNARGVLIIDGKPKSMYPRILIRLKQTSTYTDFLKQVDALHHHSE